MVREVRPTVDEEGSLKWKTPIGLARLDASNADVDIDMSGGLHNVLAEHISRIVAWGKDPGGILDVFTDSGLVLNVSRIKPADPPVNERQSAFLCMNCGQDRGTDELCTSCWTRSGMLHVVDEKIVR